MLQSYPTYDICALSPDQQDDILISRFAVDRLRDLHPDVDVFALNVEQEMNEVGYLVPGLGDAGDRLYQTR